MKQYLDLAAQIRQTGKTTNNRTQVFAQKMFGPQMRFDLRAGFPMMTTKKLHWKSIVEELLWMLRGSTDNNELKSKGVNIWNEWATENGDLGPIYGKQWRDFNGVDQIEDALNLLKTNPMSRRIIVSAWNPTDLPNERISPQENVLNGKMSLAACHAFFQFDVEPLSTEEIIDLAREKYNINIELPAMMSVEQYDKEVEMLGLDMKAELLSKLKEQGYNIPQYYLNCQLYQRSADWFLGVPFNIASYALLTHIFAKLCNMIPNTFVHTFGNAHIYSNHFDKIDLQLGRRPMQLPQLKIVDRGQTKVEDFEFEDFELIDYKFHRAIKGEVAV